MSFSSPHGELSAPVNSTAVCSLPINWLSPYHPSGNSHGCRAVGDVLRHHTTGPCPRLLAQFDGRGQHRVDAHGRDLAQLCPVLAWAVHVWRDRTGTEG